MFLLHRKGAARCPSLRPCRPPANCTANCLLCANLRPGPEICSRPRLRPQQCPRWIRWPDSSQPCTADDPAADQCSAQLGLPSALDPDLHRGRSRRAFPAELRLFRAVRTNRPFPQHPAARLYRLLGRRAELRLAQPRGRRAVCGSGRRRAVPDRRERELAGRWRFTRLHSGWQPHAMNTGAEPILTYVLWRGAGLEGLPLMGRQPGEPQPDQRYQPALGGSGLLQSVTSCCHRPVA